MERRCLRKRKERKDEDQNETETETETFPMETRSRRRQCQEKRKRQRKQEHKEEGNEREEFFRVTQRYVQDRELRDRIRITNNEDFFILSQHQFSSVERHYVVLDSENKTYEVVIGTHHRCTCSDLFEICCHILVVLQRCYQLYNFSYLLRGNQWSSRITTMMFESYPLSAQETFLASGTGFDEKDFVVEEEGEEVEQKQKKKTKQKAKEKAKEKEKEKGEIVTCYVLQKEWQTENKCPICWDDLSKNIAIAPSTGIKTEENKKESVDGKEKEEKKEKKEKKKEKDEALTWCKDQNGCGTTFHANCAQNWYETGTHRNCPVCRAKWKLSCPNPNSKKAKRKEISRQRPRPRPSLRATHFDFSFLGSRSHQNQNQNPTPSFRHRHRIEFEDDDFFFPRDYGLLFTRARGRRAEDEGGREDVDDDVEETFQISFGNLR